MPELRLGLGVRVGRKRVARLMREGGLSGVYRRRTRGCTVRDPGADLHPDLVRRRFTADAPNRLWCMDVTQHRTGEGLACDYADPWRCHGNPLPRRRS